MNAGVVRALEAVNACRAHAGGGHEGDVRVRGGWRWRLATSRHERAALEWGAGLFFA